MPALYSVSGLHGVYWKGPGATCWMSGLEPKVIQHVVSTLLSAHPVKLVVCLSTRTSKAGSAAAWCPLRLSHGEASLECFSVDEILRLLILSVLVLSHKKKALVQAVRSQSSLDNFGWNWPVHSKCHGHHSLAIKGRQSKNNLWWYTGTWAFVFRVTAELCFSCFLAS